MSAVELCPYCGTVAYPVPAETVANLAGRSVAVNSSQKWNACTNSDCHVAYFAGKNTILVADINVRLWYKDDREDVPICYCSKLTRGEIRDAVLQGCGTIDEVQKKTGKDITGKCLFENPLGQCCRNVFQKTIQDAKKHITPEDDGTQ